MSSIHNVIRHRISTAAVSLALLACSATWFVSAYALYATSGFKSDWSATPLSWMLIVMITPAICFSCGMILVDARKHTRSSWLQWSALAAAFLPITLGTLLAVWTVKGLFLMSGVGI